MKSVDIVLPAYYANIKELEPSVKTLLEFCRNKLKDYKWKIIISINGANADEIIALSKNLSKKYKGVVWLYTSEKGKGAGVINGWKNNKSDILSYMDVDLATDLSSFRNLIKQIENGYDVSIGSRYHKDSRIRRTLKRFLISRMYHGFFMKLVLGLKCSDAQCGFKAVSNKAAKILIPLIRDRHWFFETELLYIAQKKGLKIQEVPVTWGENEFSGTNMRKAIPHFFKKAILLRLRRND